MLSMIELYQHFHTSSICIINASCSLIAHHLYDTAYEEAGRIAAEKSQKAFAPVPLPAPTPTTTPYVDEEDDDADMAQSLARARRLAVAQRQRNKGSPIISSKYFSQCSILAFC